VVEGNFSVLLWSKTGILSWNWTKLNKYKSVWRLWKKRLDFSPLNLDNNLRELSQSQERFAPKFKIFYLFLFFEVVFHYFLGSSSIFFRSSSILYLRSSSINLFLGHLPFFFR
jgi:hypothetical protein